MNNLENKQILKRIDRHLKILDTNIKFNQQRQEILNNLIKNCPKEIIHEERIQNILRELNEIKRTRQDLINIDITDKYILKEIRDIRRF